MSLDFFGCFYEEPGIWHEALGLYRQVYMEKREWDGWTILNVTRCSINGAKLSNVLSDEAEVAAVFSLNLSL